MELRELLQRDVDIVSERELRREIRDRVLREAVPALRVRLRDEYERFVASSD